MPNWRNAHKSDFMASWDLDSNVILTISHVEQKMVKLAKEELKNVAYFVEKAFTNNEPIKPMILNATNCKQLNMFTGTKEIGDWKNIQVEIGVTANKGRIGEATGLSILRVVSGGFDPVQEIKKLFEKAKGNLTNDESEEVMKVINENHVNRYDKTISFLNQKLQ
jgi:hypothetical protein